MLKNTLLCSVFLISSFLCGCYSSYSAQIGSPELIRNKAIIENGRTTRNDVLSELGSPDAIGKHEGYQEKHFFFFEDMESSLINFIGSMSSTKKKVRSLQVTYDESDVVIFHEYHTGEEPKLAIPPFNPSK